jgi:hypothetical protein
MSLLLKKRLKVDAETIRYYPTGTMSTQICANGFSIRENSREFADKKITTLKCGPVT